MEAAKQLHVGGIGWQRKLKRNLRSVRGSGADICAIRRVVDGEHVRDLHAICTGLKHHMAHSHFPADGLVGGFIHIQPKHRRARRRDGSVFHAGVFHGQWSSPTVASLNGKDIIIYGGGDGFCYAFEPIAGGTDGVQTLKQVWKFDCNPPGYRERGGKKIDYWALVRGGPKDLDANGDLYSPNEIIGSPVVYENRIYVTIGQDPLHGHGRGAITRAQTGAPAVLQRKPVLAPGQIPGPPGHPPNGGMTGFASASANVRVRIPSAASRP